MVAFKGNQKTLDIEHDFSKMLPAGLVLEGGNDVVQGKMPVDHGPQVGSLDGTDKVLLLAATTNHQCLQANVTGHSYHHRQLAGKAPNQ